MANINRFVSPVEELDTFCIFDDFWYDQTDLSWIDTITDTGTVLMGDNPNGIATLTPSDGTVADNDEVYLGSANENFVFATNRRIYGRCRLSFVETTSGVYNAFFGFANAFAANLLVDDGGGMRASGCIVAIHKIDGETVWRATTRNGSASTTTVSTTSAVMTTGVFQQLEIEIDDWDGVSMKTTFKVNGEPLRDSNGQVIRHTVLIASATEMQVGAGAKLGAATNNDTLLLDYIVATQKRNAPNVF